MTNRQYFIYYAFLGILTFSVALHTVVVGSRNISYGERIQVLEKQKSALAARSAQVEQHTAQQLSMAELNAQAKQLGFVPVEHILRVGNSTVVASR